jgi:4-amino-4-deoxychorismate lyase
MSTPLLLETLRIEEGIVTNLDYHQARCDKSRKALFDEQNILKLDQNIHPPSTGIYRCRILYDTKIRHIKYIPYTPKKINTLRVVSSSLSYAYKYANREVFDLLLETYYEVDDVNIEQAGYLTDITIANIALYDGRLWWTPANPLLKGTTRQRHLDEGLLHLCHIHKKDLPHYTKIAVLNAMLGFHILKIDPKDIQ